MRVLVVFEMTMAKCMKLQVSKQQTLNQWRLRPLLVHLQHVGPNNSALRVSPGAINYFSSFLCVTV